tara:strand:- start:800 stop:1108 length:309 start_codon:yes stop_codon:yes gene_type:complete
MLDKQNDKFINRVFTKNESQYCLSKANPPVHFAGRFAAKESIKKCLLSSKIIKSIEFNQIEILSEENGAPYAHLINDLPISDINITISHEKDYAIAMAMLTL